MEIVERMHKEALKYNLCEMFTGSEDLQQICDLLTSLQGSEFCRNNDFPSMAIFEEFKAKYDMKALGVYINEGNISLTNPHKIALIGKTTATLYFDTLTNHEVYLFKGASATITACKWAVVFVRPQDGCQVEKIQKDNARIMK